MAENYVSLQMDVAALSRIIIKGLVDDSTYLKKENDLLVFSIISPKYRHRRRKKWLHEEGLPVSSYEYKWIMRSDFSGSEVEARPKIGKLPTSNFKSRRTTSYRVA